MPTVRPCPVCHRNNDRVLFNHAVEDFDGITFNRQVLIVSCRECGFVYNEAAPDQAALEKYYQDETLYSGETGFGSGGDTPADAARYSHYLAFLSPWQLSKDAAIADIGCAKGGFLAHLRENGFANIRGVEIDPKSAEYARRRFGLDVRKQSGLSLPFGDGEMDLLVYNHVLEHMQEPLTVLGEARRALKDDGLIFIEVPDASRYSHGRVFDYFWLCMREHINHFDLVHLTMLMDSAGFEKVAFCESLLPNSPRYCYPSLCALFRKSRQSGAGVRLFDSRLVSAVESYIKSEAAIVQEHRSTIDGLRSSGRPVYAWGIGLEFFALYSLAGLRDCNITGLVDRNVIKQGKTVNGMKIAPPESLRSVPPGAVVVITPVFHRNAMLEYLDEIGCRGEAMIFDDASNEGVSAGTPPAANRGKE